MKAAELLKVGDVFVIDADWPEWVVALASWPSGTPRAFRVVKVFQDGQIEITDAGDAGETWVLQVDLSGSIRLDPIQYGGRG
jgi:hypothetical protein